MRRRRLLIEPQVGRRGLAGAAILLDVVGDRLTLVQPPPAGAFDRGDVDEHIVPAIVGLDEAEALLQVEPLYDAGAGAGRGATVAAPLRRIPLWAVISAAAVETAAAAGAARPAGLGQRRAGAHPLQIDGGELARPAILLELVGDLVALVQPFQTRAFDGRDMDEDVAAAFVGRNETKPLCGIEELDDTRRHPNPLADLGLHVPTLSAQSRFSGQGVHERIQRAGKRGESRRPPGVPDCRPITV